MKTRKKIILFFLAALIFGALAFSGNESLAANCAYNCFPSVCPEGTSGISGECKDKDGYVCCAGSPTGYVGDPLSGFNPNASSGSSGANSDTGVINPISANSFSDLFQSAMNYFKTIAGTVAVLFIILGGVMYMASGGNSGMTERAKNTLIYAMVGLVVVVAAPLFLSDILLVLKGSGGGGGSSLLTIVTNVLKVLLACVGIFGILGILNGSVIMFISSGDEKTIEMGRNAVKYSLIAIALSAGSLILVQTFMAMILVKD
ncbi:MAG: pilin [Parcubacteria group bacterium]|jgi:hypothetical protein